MLYFYFLFRFVSLARSYAHFHFLSLSALFFLFLSYNHKDRRTHINKKGSSSGGFTLDGIKTMSLTHLDSWKYSRLFAVSKTISRPFKRHSDTCKSFFSKRNQQALAKLQTNLRFDFHISLASIEESSCRFLFTVSLPIRSIGIFLGDIEIAQCSTNWHQIKEKFRTVSNVVEEECHNNLLSLTHKRQSINQTYRCDALSDVDAGTRVSTK